MALRLLMTQRIEGSEYFRFNWIYDLKTKLSCTKSTGGLMNVIEKAAYFPHTVNIISKARAQINASSLAI